MPERTPEQIDALKRSRQVALDAPSGKLFDLELINKDLSCGNAHCFLGLLLSDPWFIPQITWRHRAGDLRWSMLERTLGISELHGEILFAARHGDCSSRLTGDEAKVRVLHNVDRLIAGGKPIRYRSKRWREMDLSELRAEVAASSRVPTPWLPPSAPAF